ncbi:MAG TPA: ABC transporter permease [Casimicrobiaceae bacterium]|nr:ABC transporter permease [Casimicrobiaceae bacterium]
MSFAERSFAGFWRRFRRNTPATAALVMLVAICALALVAPLVYPGDPFAIVGKPFAPPFGANLLGTDQLGRDVAAGIARGAITSLMIGIVATVCAIVIGVVVGGAAGYFGGRTDTLLMRATEAFQTVPAFIFAIVLVAILSPSLGSTIIAIAIVSWPPMARLTRGEFLATRNREFVQACLSLGMSDARVILRHILPNCTSAIIVTGSLMVATAILIESGLSFLGLGDANLMSWGYLIGAGRTALRTAWWVCAFPGIAILLTVLSINLVGEGLNDALNPRLRYADG